MVLDPAASTLDERQRFPICQPEPLLQLFRAAGFREVEIRLFDIPTAFCDFYDHWSPFLGAQWPAPGFRVSLTEERRSALQERLLAMLLMAADGSIHLIAQACAVRGLQTTGIRTRQMSSTGGDLGSSRRQHFEKERGKTNQPAEK